MNGRQVREFDWSQGDPEYGRFLAEESAVIEMSETVGLAMNLRGVSRAGLAELCGVTRSAITQRLSGEANITIRKLAAMLDVLGCDLRFQLVDRETNQLHHVRENLKKTSGDTPDKVTAEEIHDALA